MEKATNGRERKKENFNSCLVHASRDVISGERILKRTQDTVGYVLVVTCKKDTKCGGEEILQNHGACIVVEMYY